MSKDSLEGFVLISRSGDVVGAEGDTGAGGEVRRKCGGVDRIG
jgi:hypothetical protein